MAGELLEAGDKLGNWVVVRHRASGGIAHVYDVHLENAPTVVAIAKVLRHEHAENGQAVELFEREARIAQHEDLPNTPKCLGDGLSLIRGRDERYAIYELVPGHSLAEVWSNRNEPLRTISFVLEVAEKVLNTLAAAHAKGIFHLDIKPENIQIDAAGRRAYLLDFGIAKITFNDKGEISYTKLGAGLVRGSEGFMAPEQAAGHSGEIGPQTDIWGLGATLRHLLSGEQQPEADEVVAAIITRATADEPKDRYPSALEMLKDVRRALTQHHGRHHLTPLTPEVAPRPEPPSSAQEPPRSPTPPAAPTPPERQWTLAMVAIGAVLAVVAIILVIPGGSAPAGTADSGAPDASSVEASLVEHAVAVPFATADSEPPPTHDAQTSNTAKGVCKPHAVKCTKDGRMQVCTLAQAWGPVSSCPIESEICEQDRIDHGMTPCACREGSCDTEGNVCQKGQWLASNGCKATKCSTTDVLACDSVDPHARRVCIADKQDSQAGHLAVVRCPKGQWCNVVDGAAQCTECQIGAKACSTDGTHLRNCSNGKWVNTTCPGKCIGDTCVECGPGEQKCVEKSILQCTNGKWTAASECAAGCNGTVCRTCPTEGEHRCDGKKALTCTAGNWQNTDCAEGCKDGTCVSCTKLGQILCSGACVASDRSHCGSCDLSCADGSDCVESICQCPPGMVRVAGERPFCVDSHEVTVADYAGCSGCSFIGMTPSVADAGTDAALETTYCNHGLFAKQKHPINCVSFEQAKLYCEKSGKRLLRADEWDLITGVAKEYHYPWGNDVKKPEDVCYAHADGTCAVAERTGDRSHEHQIADLAANVSEWVSDSGKPAIRGGSFKTPDLTNLGQPVATPSERADWLGFRCAFDPVVRKN